MEIIEIRVENNQDSGMIVPVVRHGKFTLELKRDEFSGSKNEKHPHFLGCGSFSVQKSSVSYDIEDVLFYCNINELLSKYCIENQDNLTKETNEKNFFTKIKKKRVD